MSRSITSRNLFGGFLGGFLGILSAGYISSNLFIVGLGCLLGVIIGWWYEEIWLSAKAYACQKIDKTTKAWSNFTAFVFTPASQLKESGKAIQSVALQIIHPIAFVIGWLLRLPVVACRWFMDCPSRQAIVISLMAAVVNIAANLACVDYFLGFPRSKIDLAEKEEIFFVFGLVFIISMAISLMSAVAVSPENAARKYIMSGTIKFFFKEIVRIMIEEAWMFSVMAGMAVWFVSAGGMLLGAIVFPVHLVVGCVKGIYHVATRSGHLICFVATITVTIVVVNIAQSYFEDATKLWTIALFNGCLSGLAAEGLRRLVLLLYSANRLLARINDLDTSKFLSPAYTVFWRLTKYLDYQSRQYSPIAAN